MRMRAFGRAKRFPLVPAARTLGVKGLAAVAGTLPRFPRVVAAGSLAWLAVFWTLPTEFLSGAAAAGGIAWINALSQLSGFVGPDLLGRVRGANAGDTSLAFLILAGFALLVAVLSRVLSRQRPAAGNRVTVPG